MRTRLVVRILFAIAEILAPEEISEKVHNLANHVNQSKWEEAHDDGP